MASTGAVDKSKIVAVDVPAVRREAADDLQACNEQGICLTLENGPLLLSCRPGTTVDEAPQARDIRDNTPTSISSVSVEVGVGPGGSGQVKGG